MVNLYFRKLVACFMCVQFKIICLQQKSLISIHKMKVKETLL